MNPQLVKAIEEAVIDAAEPYSKNDSFIVSLRVKKFMKHLAPYDKLVKELEGRVAENPKYWYGRVRIDPAVYALTQEERAKEWREFIIGKANYQEAKYLIARIAEVLKMRMEKLSGM